MNSTIPMSSIWHMRLLRGIVFLLASQSFVCLLGHLYGLWSMRTFACLVLVPATIALIWSALSRRLCPDSIRACIAGGATAGLVAAVGYDIYRLPYVAAGLPVFKVFPQFGEMLLGGREPLWLVHFMGWTYHFSNGAALGIMYAALVPSSSSRFKMFWGAVVWALVVEAILLSTPYAGYFGFRLDAKFIFLTASAHLVFGIVLGWWLAARRKAVA